MAGPHYARITELKAPDNLIVDVKPMQNALMERRKAMEFDINKDQEDARLAQQASQFAQNKDLQERQFGLREQEHAQAAADRKMKMLGGLAQVIDEEADPNNRAKMWGRVRSMHPDLDTLLPKYGIDANDDVNGPKYLLAQIGQYDPQKKAERESNMAYRDAATEEMRSRGQAREMEASTKRFRAIADAGLLNNPNMSEAEWNAQNQPGGVIHAAFGGRVIPYSQAPVILAQARREVDKSFEPTEEEKLANITREDKMRAYRSQRAAELHGVSNEKLLLKGQRMNPNGSMESVPGAGNTAGERQAAVQAEQGLQLLNTGEEILKKHGWGSQTAGDEWHTPLGKVGGFGEAGRGFRMVKAAIIDLNFALSGKSVSNKEREEFLNLYMPSSQDSTATQQQKMQMIRSYFTTVIKARKANASDDELKAILDQTLDQGRRAEWDKPPTTKTPDRLPPKNDLSKLSNDDVLKGLGITR